MPTIDEHGRVIFEGDAPDFVPDYGMKGKGNWVLSVKVYDGEEEANFGYFPTDEDALGFYHNIIQTPRAAGFVQCTEGNPEIANLEMTDPRDLDATGITMGRLGLLNVVMIRIDREEAPGEDSI